MQTNQRKTTVFLISATALFMTSAASRAATNTWGNTGTNWNDSANWTAGSVPGGADVAAFTNAAYANPPWLTASSTLGQLRVGGTSAALAISNSLNQALTLNGVSEGGTVYGIRVDSGAGTVRVLPNITLGASQTWTNGSASALTVGVVAMQGNTLTLAGGAATVVGSISGAAGSSLVKEGGWNLDLRDKGVSGIGSLTINGGAVLRYNELLGAGKTVTINNAGVYYCTASGTIAQNFVLNSSSSSSQSITLESSGGGYTFAGTITTTSPYGKFLPNNYGSTVQENKLTGKITGSGAMTFVGNPLVRYIVSNTTNDYSGGTTIANGMVTVGSTNALGTGPLNIALATSTLNLSNVTLSAGALMGGGTITGDSGTPSLTVNQNSNAVFSGVIQNGGATGVALIKNGAGALTLSGTNTHTGGTTLTAGTLCLNNAAALGASAGTFTVTGGTLDNTSAAALSLTNNNPQAWIGNFAFAGTKDLNLGAGAVTLGASPTVTVNAGTLTVGGAIGGGAYGLTKAGIGTLNLTNANTYSGGTTVNAGTLLVSGAGSLASSASLTVNSGGTFSYQPATVGTVQQVGSLSLADGSVVAVNGDATTASKISASGAATVGSGAGVGVNLSGFSSGVSYTLLQAASGLDNGNYRLVNATNYTATISKSATQVQITPTTATPLTAAYWKGTAAAGLTKVWAAASGSDGNWAATAGGAAQGLVPGAGTHAYISANSPTVAPVSTKLGANMSLRGLTIQDTVNGLSLDDDGFALTLGAGGITNAASVPASTIAASVILGANQTWNNRSANALTVSGTVSGSGELTVNADSSSSGTVVFSGDNAFSGNLTLNYGVLKVTKSTSLGLSSKTYTSAVRYGTLALDGSGGDITLPAAVTYALSNDGFNGTPALRNVAGNNSVQGEISLPGGGGGLKAQVDAGTLTLAGKITNTTIYARSIVLAGAANGMISGNIFGGTYGISVTKQDAGTWTLSGANTYASGTTLSAGTLVYSNATALGSGNITFGGGVLKYGIGFTTDLSARFASSTTGAIAIDDNGQALVYANAIGASNTRGFLKLGAGTLTLSGANLYSGGTTISNGALFVNGSVTGAVTVVAGSTLGGTGVVAGVVTNSGMMAAGAAAGAIGTLTVTNLVINPFASFVVDCDVTQPQKTDLISMTGSLTLPTVATVTVNQVSGPLPDPTVLISGFANTPATLNLSQWVINGAMPDTRARVVGNQVILTRPKGTMVSFK